MEPLLIARPVLSVLLTPLYGGYRFSRLPILFFLFNSANNKDRFQSFWDTVLRQALWLFFFLEVSYVPFIYTPGYSFVYVDVSISVWFNKKFIRFIKDLLYFCKNCCYEMYWKRSFAFFFLNSIEYLEFPNICIWNELFNLS